MKTLKFYSKRLSANEREKIKQTNVIKRDFIYQTNKKRTFKGYELRYSNKYISDDECWLKFVAGSNFNNPERKLNYSRVKRVHWIFMILDLYQKHEQPYKIYSNLEEIVNPNNKKVITVRVVDENYNLFFELYDDKENPYYLLTSAYYKGKQKRKAG